MKGKRRTENQKEKEKEKETETEKKKEKEKRADLVLDDGRDELRDQLPPEPNHLPATRTGMSPPETHTASRRCHSIRVSGFGFRVSGFEITFQIKFGVWGFWVWAHRGNVILLRHAVAHEESMMLGARSSAARARSPAARTAHSAPQNRNQHSRKKPPCARSFAPGLDCAWTACQHIAQSCPPIPTCPHSPRDGTHTSEQAAAAVSGTR
eukprot:1685759-Rhodomonas_salina.1